MRPVSWWNRGRPGLTLAIAAVVLASVAATPAGAAGDCPAGTRNMLEAAKRREMDDLEGALRDYATLIESFGESVCGAEAMLRLAAGRYESQGDLAGAREMARQLVARHPTTRFAASAHVLLGRVLWDLAGDAEAAGPARDQLRNAWLLFPPDQYRDLEARAEARVRFGELSFRLGDDAQAAAAFLAVIEDEPASVQRWRALSGLAAVLLARGDWRPAAELLQEVVEGGGEAPAGAALAAAAARRLTLVHRARLRPESGEGPWRTSRLLGAERLGLGRVQHLAVREDGRLLVGGSGAEVVIVEASGEVSSRTSVPGLGGVFWGPDGEPYAFGPEEVRGVGDAARRRLSRPLGEDGKPLKDLKGAHLWPFGGWIVLAERRWHLFGRDGAFAATFGDPSTLQAADLVLDSRRRVMALDGRSERVVRLAGDGSATRVAAADWKRPQALAIDELGRIYVLDQATGVQVFGPEGKLEARLGKSLPGGVSLRDPVDLGVDGAGRLFIADRGLKEVVVLE